ncbi:MAG: hypothetical protein WBL35_09865, partial [Ornithinibacter sp.]
MDWPANTWKRVVAIVSSLALVIVTFASAQPAYAGPPAGPVADHPMVTPAQQLAESILAAAASRYPGQEERLTTGITLELKDLPDGLVGVAYKSSILLDTDAGGHGWFVDPTPGVDEEFIAGVAPKGSPAYGKMDLLSVLSHEMGHVLGLDDVDPASTDLMGADLQPGERVTETTQSIDPQRALGTRGGNAYALHLADSATTEEAAPAAETTTTEEAAPAAETTTTEEAAPAAETTTTEEPAPAAETTTTEDPGPAAETTTNEA